MYDNEYGGFMGFRGWHGQHRAGRGDMAPIILRVLLQKPMHGYEIISTLEEKSHGFWRPSAGSIYPNLQLLEERGLITSQDENGKKVYTLTDEGKQEAEKVEENFKAHWEHKEQHVKHFKELKPLLGETFMLLKQIEDEGSEEKFEAVKKVIQEMRDKLAKLA
jgi:DNA-binding PadR family transcriptional regulator